VVKQRSMASVGTGHFEPSREDISTWLLRLQCVMTCQKSPMPKENQREWLLDILEERRLKT
jgi:hypothetical protein